MHIHPVITKDKAPFIAGQHLPAASIREPDIATGGDPPCEITPLRNPVQVVSLDKPLIRASRKPMDPGDVIPSGICKDIDLAYVNPLKKDLCVFGTA
jgi:hypothetical protein